MPASESLPSGSAGFTVDPSNLRRRSAAVDAANDTAGAALRTNAVVISDARTAWAGTTQSAFDGVANHFAARDLALSTKLTDLATSLQKAATRYDGHDESARDALTPPSSL